MKNFLIFILISTSNYILACGFYPYGESTRISLFDHHVFGYDTYSGFYYSADYFTDNRVTNPKTFDLPNNQLWFNYCGGKVDIPAIDFAVYHLSAENIDAKCTNKMIHYLYEQKDTDAIAYLRFAKHCEFFNSLEEDPWERRTHIVIPKRKKLIKKAVDLAGKTNSSDLKRRYTFLAIRMAWYNHEFDKISKLFAAVFAQSTEKDILYYWSLYYQSFTERDSTRLNYNLAQIFANAPEKRFMCHQYYHAKVSIEQCLKHAKTDKERANVYLLYGIEKPDKALPYLEKIYTLAPSSDGLSFLLLREINKIEDYVFTPYYSMFEPSITTNADYSSTQIIINRSEQDRIYAKSVLQFVNKANMTKVENPFFWKCAGAYLRFITRDYNGCLNLLGQLNQSTSDSAIKNQLQIIKSLALIANQPLGTTVIPDEVKSIIINNSAHDQFLFACAKEFEYLGNTTLAALIFSNLDTTWDEEKPVFWKSLKNYNQIISDYYINYYDYADAVYTPEQIQGLIDNIEQNKSNKDLFSVFIYNKIQQELPRLYDLMGTKYIRLNNLDMALATFSKIKNSYWQRNYSYWSESNNIFYANPFYWFKYTPSFIAIADTIRLNKYTITRQLISYLKQAENITEKDRDYYYFIVANAYYNMGREGNAYMMRRFRGWSAFYLSNYEDEVEFRQSNLAKQYYLLAKKHAKTNQFRALCLRMVAKCERHHLEYKYLKEEEKNYKLDSLLATNRYLAELKRNYPNYFDDLASNCDRFESYFKARR